MKIRHITDVIKNIGKTLKDKSGNKIKIEDVSETFKWIQPSKRYYPVFSHCNIKILEHYNSFGVIVERKFEHVYQLSAYFEQYELEEEKNMKEELALFFEDFEIFNGE